MIAALLLLAAVAAGAPAQPPPIAHQHQEVVDAIRNCPKPVEGEITVCAPDRGVAEGYRIPRMDPRFAGAGLRPSGRGTLVAPGVAATGTGSCSNVGASGATGCSLRDAKAWGQWKKQAKEEGQVFPW